MDRVARVWTVCIVAVSGDGMGKRWYLRRGTVGGLSVDYMTVPMLTDGSGKC